MNQKGSTHLTKEERRLIEEKLCEGLKCKEIAALIGKDERRSLLLKIPHFARYTLCKMRHFSAYFAHNQENQGDFDHNFNSGQSSELTGICKKER